MSSLSSERYGVTLAPDGLLLVQDLLNTVPAGPHEDLLDDLGTTRQWLVAVVEGWAGRTDRAMPQVALEAADLARLRVTRDHFRRAVAGAARDSHAVRPARDMTGSLELEMSEDGWVTASPHGDGARWVESAALGEWYLAQHNDSARRLKVCRKTACSVAFFDRSRNNNGVWHDVRVCGNAVNLRASRARRAAQRTNCAGSRQERR